MGTLVITHLTQQDLRAKEILLPKQAVEANILPALTYSLLKFKVLQSSCCITVLHPCGHAVQASKFLCRFMPAAYQVVP